MSMQVMCVFSPNSNKGTFRFQEFMNFGTSDKGMFACLWTRWRRCSACPQRTQMLHVLAIRPFPVCCKPAQMCLDPKKKKKRVGWEWLIDWVIEKSRKFWTLLNLRLKWCHWPGFFYSFTWFLFQRFPSYSLVASVGSSPTLLGRQRVLQQLIPYSSFPRKKKAPSFCSSIPSKHLLAFHWLSSSHMLIFEPITEVRKMRCADWLGLGSCDPFWHLESQACELRRYRLSQIRAGSCCQRKWEVLGWKESVSSTVDPEFSL